MGIAQKITPCLWFDRQANAASQFYTSVFKGSSIKSVQPLENTPSGPGAAVVTMEILGQEFMLLDGGPFFKINEAVSFVINCEDQAETDYYWEKLSAVPEAEQCGWCKDKFGVSWQVVPVILNELLADKDKARSARVMQCMLKMKKIDIKELKKAYEG